MRHSAISLACALTLLLASGATGQQYEPSHAVSKGQEMVAVFLTAWSCGPCRGPEIPTLIDSIKVQLRRQAQAWNEEFRAVFVGMDWETERSLELAKMDGLWDEIIVGRNWFNVGAEINIWGDSATSPAMPQIVVYEQGISMGDEIRFGPRRVLRRVVGSEDLADWVAQGSPISNPLRR